MITCQEPKIIITEEDGSTARQVKTGTYLFSKKSEKNEKKVWKWAKFDEIHSFFQKKIKILTFFDFSKNHKFKFLILWIYKKS